MSAAPHWAGGRSGESGRVEIEERGLERRPSVMGYVLTVLLSSLTPKAYFPRGLSAICLGPAPG